MGKRAPTDEEKREKQARALAIHAELVQLQRAENLAACRKAELLATVRREQLHEPFGQSFGAYAEQYGFATSARQAFAATHVWKQLDAQPALKAASTSGEVSWAMVRDAASFATPGNDAELAALVKTGSAADLRARKLQEQVQRGESPSTTLEIPLDSKVRLGHLRGLLSGRLAESLGRELSLGETLDHAIDAAITAEHTPTVGEDGKVVRAPVALLPESLTRLHIFEEGAGKGLWIHGAEGPVTLGQSTGELLRCCSEALTGKGEVRPAVPRRMARTLWSLDQGMCVVPGCRHRAYLHIHHEGGYEQVGHDLEHMLLLCSGHHRMRHQGWVRIEGVRSTGFRFFRVDGVQITGRRPTAEPISVEREERKLA
jgi:hypothetical protein